MPAREVCSFAATLDMWKQRDCEHCWQKSQYENVVLCGPRQRSPVAWVNEVISRDGVSCHTSGTWFRIQSPSHASITGPPRQLTRRSNTVYIELSKSKTVVLRAIPFTDIGITGTSVMSDTEPTCVHSLVTLPPLGPNDWQLVSVPENTKQEEQGG